jgi:hypothetical protein
MRPAAGTPGSSSSAITTVASPHASGSTLTPPSGSAEYCGSSVPSSSDAGHERDASLVSRDSRRDPACWDRADPAAGKRPAGCCSRWRRRSRQPPPPQQASREGRPARPGHAGCRIAIAERAQTLPHRRRTGAVRATGQRFRRSVGRLLRPRATAVGRVQPGTSEVIRKGRQPACQRADGQLCAPECECCFRADGRSPKGVNVPWAVSLMRFAR